MESPLSVHSHPVGPLGCNMSIVFEKDTKEAVLIDPGGDPENICNIIDSFGINVTKILVTHGHFDHFLAAEEIRAKTSAPIYLHADDLPLWHSVPLQCMLLGLPQPPKMIKQPEFSLHHGDCIGFHNGVVLHTPGHTKGSCCFHFPDDRLLFSGDTLFNEGVGRTDFPGGSSVQLMESIRGQLLVMPEDTRVIAGHGDETSIGNEKESNPFIQNL